MNQGLFCSIYVDTDLPRDTMASLVASLTGGEVERRGVNCSWARITFDDNYGDFEMRQRDPGDFLGWSTLLEIMPPDDAKHDDVVRGVVSLMNALITRGLRVLGQADYAEKLPGAGEVDPAASTGQ
jgi:hypothetical protein